jgi:hypothetical protein
MKNTKIKNRIIMKNIHLIPTDKPTYLYKFKGKLYLSEKFEKADKFWNNQNIYITSDEEIKTGDYYLYGDEILKSDKLGTFDVTMVDICKKIILTTDQDLIKDSVQAIDNEFLYN